MEVVRSNASAVWGNASGGVINVSSNTTFEQPFVNLQSLFGSFGFRKQTIRAGAFLGNSRYFLSLSNTTSDGWRNHSASSQFLVNTGLVSQVGERTNVGIFLTGTSNVFRIPGPLTQAQYDSLPEQSDSVFIKRDDRRVNRLGRLGATVSHEFNDANSIAASIYASPKSLQRSERNRYRDFNRYHVGGNATFKNSSALSSTMLNTILVGVDEAYQDGSILFYNLTANGDRSTTLRANKREGANNFGIFLQNESVIGEEFSVSLGGRYDNITYYYDDYITPVLNDRKSFERFTPKVGLTYRFSPTHSVYANLGGGVEVPAGNEVDPSPTFGDDTIRAINPLLEPITSATIEAGTKHILPLGDEGSLGTLMYDAAIYWIEVRNDIIPYSGGAFYFTAGKTNRIGAEFGGTIQFTNGLSLGTAITLSSNKYAEYTIDSVHYGKPGASSNLKDNKTPGVPDVFYTIDVRYAPPLLKGIYAKATLRSVGSYFADDRNMFEVPSYSTLDLTLGLDRMKVTESGLVLSGFVTVNNATNKKYVASAWINPDLVAGNPVYIEPGLPRNVVGGLTVGWEF